MERIEKEAQRMSTLVTDLLELARLDENKPVEMSRVSLLTLAQDAALDNSAIAPDRVIAASLADGSLPEDVVIDAEEDKLRQVLTNLLQNARRFSPEGSPIEISVSRQRRPDRAMIRVVDHGEGIPEQIKEKIFQRFWRADTSRARETGGSGLGLAIVATIVARHHGEIRVVDTPGGGATFEVSFPLVHTGK